MGSFAAPGPLTTPVLFIAFNREEPARIVLESIRAAKPPRLYFACDGPRNEGEKERCEKVRALVSLVDWECEVFTRFSNVNLGVMKGESSAMDWFFEHEEEGIILEDDTCPSQSFFWYCQELLERYRHDERVWCIMGNNLMPEWNHQSGDSYYISAHGYGAYWGWAGWRRVWRKYDVNMVAWPACRDEHMLDGHFYNGAEKAEAYMLFDAQFAGMIRSWDYQMDFGRILNRGVTCIPNVNLVRNVGFGGGGSNTKNERDPRNKSDLSELAFPLVHPKHLLVDIRRDMAYFERYIRTTRFRRFKQGMKKILPDPFDKALTSVLSKAQRLLGIG